MTVPVSFAKTRESSLFLGRDLDGEELWASSSMFLTHLFVLGSTGSGKTEFLTNLMSNVAAWGSGGVFIDGKGDLTFFSKLHAVMTAMGREDDLLLVNFGPKGAVTSDRKHTHTINPFCVLSADELSLIMTGMLGKLHDPMWSGRAIAMMNAIIYSLVWLRDAHGEPMTIGKIRSLLSLNHLIRLYMRLQKMSDVDTIVMREMDFYFDTLPDFNIEKGEKQGGYAPSQHAFLSMQWTRPVGMIASAYGHIFDSEVPEVDIRDVVLNRRILVILLPSLDRSSDDVRQIGNLLVGMLKSMLGQSLRSPVEGSWSDVVRRRITNATHPFMMVMDEVAQYLTDGMGMMAQQARSLNVGLVFATQDFDSLHHANPRETDAILANTNIKVFMKAENPSASQIRSVLSSFVDRRRFEKSKFIDVLRAKKEGLTHRLTYEPRKIDRSDAYVSMQPDQAKAEALYALDEQGVRHYENAEPEDLALMLRGFRPGDMLVTYGSDMVVGRAGYVALDHGRGSEHEIRLPRMIHVSGYGQRAADARKLREDSEQVLASMRKGYDAQPRTPDYPMHAVLSNPERSIVDPRTVEDDNIRNIWAELLFVHLKGSFPEDLSDMICGYAKRRMVVLNHDDAVKMPTRKPSASGRRSSGTPVQYDVLKLFEDAA